MTFLYPFGLIGLLSLPVIVVLHMLRERKRNYVVSNLDLWAFLEIEAHAPRIRRIPITRLLLLDLVIASLMSLAWAQPHLYLPLAEQSARHTVFLLDVSTSMLASDGSHPGFSNRFERSKADLLALLDGRGKRDVITILAFGGQARLVADSRQMNFDQMLERLNNIQAGETGTRSALQEALALGQAAIEASLPIEFHIMTDGNFLQDDAQSIHSFPYPQRWHITGQAVENQAVIEINATKGAMGGYQIFTRLANFGNQKIRREAVLEIDGRPVEREEIEIPADSSVPMVWQTPPIASEIPMEAVFSLLGADGLPEDDTAAIGLQQGGETRVLLVADEPRPLLQAARAVPGTEVEVIAPSEYSPNLHVSENGMFDLTIFRNYQPAAWPEGQVLIVDPPESVDDLAEPDAPSAVSLISRTRQVIPAGATVWSPISDPFIEGIDFSGVRWSRTWMLEVIPPGFLPVLQAGETPILLRGKINKTPTETSRIFVLLADLERGNFTKHPAFPILMAKIIEDSRQSPLPAEIKTGEAFSLPQPGSFQSIELIPPTGSVVEHQPNWPEKWVETNFPGLYRFRFTRFDGETIHYSAGANAGDAVESDLRMRGLTELPLDQEAQSSGLPEDEERQIDLTPWLLGAVIMLLFVEAFLAWRR